MASRICHIVGAAPGELDAFQLGEGDLLIAADGGYDKCLARGLKPALLIGDFDSLEGGIPDGAACPCTVLPRAKDDTDLMVCVQEALFQGFKDIRLHCALGGDLGHTVAAIKTLAWARLQGVSGALYGGGQTALLVMAKDGEVFLADWFGPLAPGTRVSVSSFGGDASGVCEKDLLWELEDADMAAADHFGVSNEVPEGNVSPCVSVKNGTLLVVIG